MALSIALLCLLLGNAIVGGMVEADALGMEDITLLRTQRSLKVYLRGLFILRLEDIIML